MRVPGNGPGEHAYELKSLYLTQFNGRGFLTREYTWGFPTIRGTFLGVPIIRTIVYWGLYWVPPILGNYHLHTRRIPVSKN